jgi:hypothetical protein
MLLLATLAVLQPGYDTLVLLNDYRLLYPMQNYKIRECLCHHMSYLIRTVFLNFVNVALGPGVYSASNRNEYQKHKNNVSGE